LLVWQDLDLLIRAAAGHIGQCQRSPLASAGHLASGSRLHQFWVHRYDCVAAPKPYTYRSYPAARRRDRAEVGGRRSPGRRPAELKYRTGSV